MDNYKFIEFGNRLKSLREDCHIKQGQFADKIGITRQSMSNYESGKHSPDIDVIIKMADCLDCSADYLLGLTKHRSYDSHTEFDESMSKLNSILLEIPEPLRIQWLDIFLGTAQWIAKDIKGDVQFHHSVLSFYGILISLAGDCLTVKEQGCSNEQITQAHRDKRFRAMLQLRSELDNLDAISYQYTSNLQPEGGE